MASIDIRIAIIGDIHALLPLLEQLGYPCTEEELKARFRAFTQNHGNGVAVSTIEHAVVGWVAWSRSRLFVSDIIRYHVEGLVVDERCRSMGIGRKLMKFVEDIAHKNSPSIVDLTSGLRREKDGSHEFYKKLGYHNEGRTAKLYLRKEF